MKSLNSPQDYIEVAFRRKWWIIVPFVLVIMGSYAVYKKLPKIYKATTLILVQPQKIPSNYVQPTVTLSVSDRLATISQQILSRTSLEQVIAQLYLINNLSDPLLLNKKVESMRESINIDVHHGGRRGESTSSFTISFEDENPSNAAQIVNKIASLFIMENLKVREEQAASTSQFLEKELLDIEKRLKQNEEAIRSFKERYVGELPAQLDANLRILERLQQQVQTNNESLISAQERKTNLEYQVDQIREARAHAPNDQGIATQDPLLTQLNNQRRHLQELQAQYTDKHPDIIMAKAGIEELENRIRERKEENIQRPQETTPTIDPTFNRLNTELQEVVGQIDRLSRGQANMKDQIALYQRRVENVPKREEQMSTLLRDYSLLQENYQSLLDKKIQAQLAENLEKRQKGEQFKILDPATPPMYPFKPDKKKFFALAFALALGFGGGLAYLREYMDRSFYKVDDIEQFLGFPVIATIPKIEKRKNEKKLSQAQVSRHFYKKEHNGKQISTT